MTAPVRCFVATFVVAITVVLSGCSNKPKTTAGEPGLQDTQAWMHGFVSDKGAGAIYEGRGCSGNITWLTKDTGYYSFTFSFGDLDPNTAKSVQTVVSPPALQNMWRATAVATNNLKKVAVYNYRSKQQEQDSVIEGISFYSKEDADRFATVFRHAIVLCGGKPSSF